MMDAIAKIFEDSRWRFARKNGAASPNKLATLELDDTTKIGAVVVLRSDDGKDFALNAAGLGSVVDAEDDGRIRQAFIVLGQHTDDGLTFVAAEKAKTVATRLCDIPPRSGVYGKYWWITSAFAPAETEEFF